MVHFAFLPFTRKQSEYVCEFPKRSLEQSMMVASNDLLLMPAGPNGYFEDTSIQTRCKPSLVGPA